MIRKDTTKMKKPPGEEVFPSYEGEIVSVHQLP